MYSEVVESVLFIDLMSNHFVAKANKLSETISTRQSIERQLIRAQKNENILNDALNEYVSVLKKLDLFEAFKAKLAAANMQDVERAKFQDFLK